ncbi:MAG: MFS transporter, partial [Gammaproteobacteria bacterium]
LLGVSFCCLNVFSGISRAWYESVTQACISDYAPADKKLSAFGLRYIAANVGSALGPLFGALLGISGSLYGFYATGAILFAYLICLSVVLLQHQSIETKAQQSNINFGDIIKILCRDKSFAYLNFGCAFAYFGFVQQEVLFGQVLFIKLHDIHLLAILLFLNAMLAILLQIPVSQFFGQRFSYLSTMIFGVFLLAMGLIGIGNSGTNILFYIISEIIFTLGEILVFSFSSVAIDMMAPANLRGSYFGAATFQFIGRAIGPPVGGLLLELLGVSLSLSAIALLTSLSIFCFYRSIAYFPTPLPKLSLKSSII